MSAVIENDRVVSFNYVLTDPLGELLDSTEGEPLEYLHGHDNIIPGLERALANHKVGDKLRVEVAPEEGYGSHDPEKRFHIKRAHFGKEQIEPGMMVELTPDKGHSFMATIVELSDEDGTVLVDANHPMAGKHLCFEVEVVAIREALPDEIEHGHVHGPHGHHHH